MKHHFIENNMELSVRKNIIKFFYHFCIAYLSVAYAKEQLCLKSSYFFFSRSISCSFSQRFVLFVVKTIYSQLYLSCSQPTDDLHQAVSSVIYVFQRLKSILRVSCKACSHEMRQIAPSCVKWLEMLYGESAVEKPVCAGVGISGETVCMQTHKSINTSSQAHFGNSNPDLTEDRDSISIWRFQCGEHANNIVY